jgi:hypothetical protein
MLPAVVFFNSKHCFNCSRGGVMLHSVPGGGHRPTAATYRIAVTTATAVYASLTSVPVE